MIAYLIFATDNVDASSGADVNQSNDTASPNQSTKNGYATPQKEYQNHTEIQKLKSE